MKKGTIISTETLVYDEPQHLPKKLIIKKYKTKAKPQEDNPPEVDLQGLHPGEENPPEEILLILKQNILKQNISYQIR